MSSKSKSNKQAKNLVCGICGIDLNKNYISVKRQGNKPMLYRCVLCVKVQIKRDETELLALIQQRYTYNYIRYDIPVHIIKELETTNVKLFHRHQFNRYTKAYLNKLIDMLKTDLQELNQYKYKMSRQYLMGISSKLIELSEYLTEHDSMNEETYRMLCECLQKYLNNFDNIFETKLFIIRNNY